MENVSTIFFKSHSDRIEVKEVVCSDNFNLGDLVTFKPNGLQFRVDNKKTLRWMKESGNYAKLIL